MKIYNKLINKTLVKMKIWNKFIFKNKLKMFQVNNKNMYNLIIIIIVINKFKKD